MQDKVLLDTDAGADLPANVAVRLTWDGTPQAWVNFGTTGAAPGDQLALAVQVANAVSVTGVYAWSIEVRVDYPTGPAAFGVLSGTTPVVVAASTFGLGWNIAGVDRLAFVRGGVLWVQGNGDSTFFAHDTSGTNRGDGTYLNPPGEFGTLVQHRPFTIQATRDTTELLDDCSTISMINDASRIGLPSERPRNFNPSSIE